MLEFAEVLLHRAIWAIFVLHITLQRIFLADVLHDEQDTEWLTLTLSCPSPVTV